MEIIYITGIVILLIIGLACHYYRSVKIAARNFDAQSRLAQTRFAPRWTQFIPAVLLVIVGFTGTVNWIMVSLGLAWMIAETAESFISAKFRYAAFLIQGNQLIANYYRPRIQQIDELTSIGFLPISDSFKLNFIKSKPLRIPRTDFDNKLLVVFLKEILAKSTGNVLIDDDAKSKIQE